MNNLKNKPVSIGEAAKLTGVSLKQIRFWDEKGYIPSPERVKSGARSFRYFNERDLEILARIKSYLDAGYTIQAAASKTKEEFNYSGDKK
jgi:DNA-binding transcriptional MerR regulator